MIQSVSLFSQAAGPFLRDYVLKPLVSVCVLIALSTLFSALFKKNPVRPTELKLQPSRFQDLSGSLENVKNLADILKKHGFGGMDPKQIEILQDFLLLNGPELASEAEARGLKQIKGVLLFGPPGTGKSTLAAILAAMCCQKKRQITQISGSQVLHQFIGMTEANIRRLFEQATKDPKTTHVLIIDEIDSLITKRSFGSEGGAAQARVSICNQLLTCMDGANMPKNMFVFGTTNHLEELDPAAIRPGRFDLHFKVDLPTPTGREEIFGIYLAPIAKAGQLQSAIKIDILVEMTKGFSGAAIEAVVRSANRMAFRRGHLQDASKLSVTKEDLVSAIDDSKRGAEEDNGYQTMYA